MAARTFLLSCVANVKLSHLALAFSVFPHNVAAITFSVLEFRHDQTIAAASSSDATPIITDSLTSILPPPRALREHIKRPLRPPETPPPRLPRASSAGAALSPGSRWFLAMAAGVRRHGLTSITVKDDGSMCSGSRCGTSHEACRANDRDGPASPVKEGAGARG